MNSKVDMQSWRVQSPEAPGFHCVLSPGRDSCREIWLFRLNMKSGEVFLLKSLEKELHCVLIQGSCEAEGIGLGMHSMKKFDSFYIPAENEVKLTSSSDCIFYIAGAIDEGYGKALFRAFEKDTPIGDIHQIHGSGSGQREVMFTLAPTDAASRLICGLTWGGDGAWTSWPPHQHEQYLEEVYCYFDMPLPHVGFHVSYLESGDIENMVFHPVYSGTVVQAPRGYHPTVSTPGSRNSYLWVLSAKTHADRSYDLAKPDPVFDY